MTRNVFQDLQNHSVKPPINKLLQYSNIYIIKYSDNPKFIEFFKKIIPNKNFSFLYIWLNIYSNQKFGYKSFV